MEKAKEEELIKSVISHFEGQGYVFKERNKWDYDESMDLLFSKDDKLFTFPIKRCRVPVDEE